MDQPVQSGRHKKLDDFSLNKLKFKQLDLVYLLCFVEYNCTASQAEYLYNEYPLFRWQLQYAVNRVCTAAKIWTLHDRLLHSLLPTGRHIFF